MVIIEAIKEYRQYLIVEKGLSKNTIIAYIRDLEKFSIYLNDNFQITQIDDLSKEHIRLYLKELGKTNASTSVARKLVSLRMFFNF